ncbi:hypothetical protein BCV69DRAFT_281718 [Microstroma glucosiphilum]|uniref:Uncharacterized protein n=1 Tax=Pseudomicrostroma glucosiphilum TaxID=1684307 RepID=A0A316UBG0_9BASI|nr:hypothetical protein BCV69DRAFT_281718 [Pseudomicrostroma glucosiphilum]PWN21791.1 hypothetical protein BCV69DRAFT_281718 [Pseudomicrostroma glucosiphilum]
MQYITHFTVLVFVTGLVSSLMGASAAPSRLDDRTLRPQAVLQEPNKPIADITAPYLQRSVGTPFFDEKPLLIRSWSSDLDARVQESQRPPPILVPPKKRPSLRSPVTPDNKPKFKSLAKIYKKTANVLTCQVPSPTTSTPGASSASSSKYPPPPPNSSREYKYGKLVSGGNKKWLSLIRSKCNAVRYNVRWKKGGS